MNRADARARVRRARAEVDQAEQRVAVQWRPLRESLGRHRLALLIGGGLLGGFAVAGASPKYWSRAGAALFGAGARLARSPIGPALLGGLLTRFLGSSNAISQRAAGDAAPAAPDA